MGYEEGSISCEEYMERINDLRDEVEEGRREADRELKLLLNKLKGKEDEYQRI